MGTNPDCPAYNSRPATSNDYGQTHKIAACWEERAKKAEAYVDLLTEDLAATSMTLTADLATASTGQLKAEARIIELEANQDHTLSLEKLLESSRIDRNATAERVVALEAKLSGMTATMQQWRGLAEQRTKEEAAARGCLDDLKVRNGELTIMLDNHKDIYRHIVDVPGVIALLINHITKPLDENAAGLGEPEPLEDEEDYRAG